MNEALKIAIKAVDDKKGIDIVALDISAVATFADCFLLCSGDSSRQIQAIANEVEEKLAANGHRPAHVEGYSNAEWILMDYLDLVVHIFSKEARAYYDLERLWRDAKTIDVAKLLEQGEPEVVPVRRPRRRRS
ncbi:MAG: ribosome silencing factor [Acidobacteriia bacterium]|nr:ribosome silencing factor [Terriglobia bacterium]